MGRVKIQIQFTVSWMESSRGLRFYHSKGFYEEYLDVWRLSFKLVWRPGMRPELKKTRREKYDV